MTLTSQLESYLSASVEFRKRAIPTPDGYAYNSMEEYVLRNGQAFTPAKRPKGVRQMAMKMCFRNTYRLVTSTLGETLKLRYVEGYAIGVIPVLHAWAVTPEGLVVDSTWRDGTDYYGVVFDITLVNQAILRSGYYGVLDDWRSGYPLLKQP